MVCFDTREGDKPGEILVTIKKKKKKKKKKSIAVTGELSLLTPAELEELNNLNFN